jgi:hypothetical protein
LLGKFPKGRETVFGAGRLERKMKREFVPMHHIRFIAETLATQRFYIEILARQDIPHMNWLESFCRVAFWNWG